MHTLESRILYSEHYRGDNPGQRPIKVFTTIAAHSSATPLGFFCGGFSSTAGYVPGNEAQQSLPKEKRERRSTYELIISHRRYSFLFE
jgi:hypothetical protein